MFFGADQSVQRYDVFKYPTFDKLNQKMLGYYWRPEEVSLQKDRADYQLFRPEQKHIFTANLKYQTLLDSVQGRGPSLAFLPYVSNPELEGCIVTWDFFEALHSRSYTYIMKNVYANPTEIFDTIIHDKEILKRAVSVTENYDKFLKVAQDYFVKGKGELIPPFTCEDEPLQSIIASSPLIDKDKLNLIGSGFSPNPSSQST